MPFNIPKINNSLLNYKMLKSRILKTCKLRGTVNPWTTYKIIEIRFLYVPVVRLRQKNHKTWPYQFNCLVHMRIHLRRQKLNPKIE